MKFYRQKYWSVFPFPSPGDIPDPGIEPRLPKFQADSLQSEPPRKPPKIDKAMTQIGVGGDGIENKGQALIWRKDFPKERRKEWGAVGKAVVSYL